VAPPPSFSLHTVEVSDATLKRQTGCGPSQWKAVNLTNPFSRNFEAPAGGPMAHFLPGKEVEPEIDNRNTHPVPAQRLFPTIPS
jgi:hypothetical protein